MDNIKKIWFVYIIACNDRSLYTGATSNLDRRLYEHKAAKGGRYTKNHKPIEILYSEKYISHKDALQRERQIKGWSRKKKINLIKFGSPK